MRENPILHAFGPGYPDPALGGDKFPFYFEFTGAPYNDGIFYGRRCKNALQKILVEDRINRLWGWASLEKSEIELILDSAEKIMEFYPDYREELSGIAKGADIPFADLLLATLLPEACIAIGKLLPDRPSDCTFCAYHNDGATIIANNIDNPPRYTVVHFKRKGSFSYITFFYLGRIWGGGPGINEHGLTLAEISIPPNPNWERDVTSGKKIQRFKGSCGFIENRRVLENAKTVNEALDLLKEKANLFRSTALLIADAQGDLAIVSRTVGFQSVYRPTESKIAWPNICFDRIYIKKVLDMTEKQYLKWHNKRKDYAKRLRRLEFLTDIFLRDKNAVDMESMWKLMRTKPYVCRKNTAITAVMDPKNRQFFVAQGKSSKQPKYILRCSIFN